MHSTDLLSSLFDLPAAVQYRVLDVGIPRIVPLTKGLGLRVREISDARAVTTVPLSRRAKNHVGGMYFGVLLTAAEVTMGLYVMRRLRPPRFVPLVARQEASFLAQARGPVRAVCEPDGEAREAIERALTMAPGRQSFWMPARVEDARDGKVLVEVRFEVSVKRAG